MHTIHRRLTRSSLLLVMAIVVALFLGAVFTAEARAVSYTSEETSFLQLLNDYREGLGLQPLLASDQLSESGDRHDSDMGKYGFFDHYTKASDWFPVGASPWDRMAQCGYDYRTSEGENIAAGVTYSNAAGVFEAWKNSPSHNHTMTDANFKVVGISLTYVPGSVYGYYWTTDFGGYVDPSAHALGGSGSGSGGGGMFSDVGSGTLYASQIIALANKGIVSGYGNGAFGPYDTVTRQQFTKMIMLALGYDVPRVSSTVFIDVTSASGSDDPLYPVSYVAACASRGITAGKTPYTFDPYGDVTRAQLITMVARAKGLCDPPVSYQPPFPDFSDDHYPWARKAAYAGLLDGFVGMGPSFNFSACATRAEVCLLLASLLN